MSTTNVFEKTSEIKTTREERAIPLAYGSIPHKFADKVDQIIAPDHAIALENLDQALDLALDEPIGQQRLQEFIEPHHKIGIVVSDKSRKIPREKMINAIHRELPHIPYSQFTLIIANGTHKPSKPEELGLSLKFIEKYKWVSHNSCDFKQLKLVGRAPWKMKRLFFKVLLSEIRKSWHSKSTALANWWKVLKSGDGDGIKQLIFISLPMRLTLLFISSLGFPIFLNKALFEVDWIITIGQIQPHYFAGFSGGIKGIFPGVAAKVSIAFNHFMKIHPTAKIGNLDQNIIRDDLESVVKLLPKITILNVVNGPHGKHYGVVSGDPILAHRDGTRICKEANIGEFKRKSEIVVVSASEPMGKSIYQLAKALVPASFCVKSGGTIICTGTCSDGIGGSYLIVNQIIFNNGIKQYLPKGVSLKLVSEAHPNVVDKSFLTHSPSIETALDEAFFIYGEDARLTVIPEAAQLMVMQKNSN